jgi:hypothetical protein
LSPSEYHALCMHSRTSALRSQNSSGQLE